MNNLDQLMENNTAHLRNELIVSLRNASDVSEMLKIYLDSLFVVLLDESSDIRIEICDIFAKYNRLITELNEGQEN